MIQPTRALDQIIRTTLGDEEAALRDRFGEQSTGELFIEAMRGPYRAWMGAGMVVSLAFLAVGIHAALQFAQATDVRSMLLWGGVAMLCFGVILAVKIWSWLEMMRGALAREIRRLELQVLLAGRPREG
jgi:hypothetical protein